MLITIVISMLFAISCQTILSFCAKKSDTVKKIQSGTAVATPSPLPNAPAAAPTPIAVSTKVDREERDSTRTKLGNRKGSLTKEPDSVDDAFKEMAAKLANKAKPDKTLGESLMCEDDENPMANFCMPERPVVELRDKFDGAKLANIVEMEKKPTKVGRITPVGGPATAREMSVARTVSSDKGQNKKAKSKKSRSKREGDVQLQKTQSAQKDDEPPAANVDIDRTQDLSKDVDEENVKTQATTNTMPTMRPRGASIMQDPK
uniref:Uncharacterized protein n=1 Tax=Caenorhabditis japonica TaxID=281687 RepID=A0A8R1DLM6_CAEJA